jgi:acyl carrier protein
VTDNELRTIVLGALHRIAPEADLDALGADVDLREALELDSMDFLTFVDELCTRTGVDVPERDYPSLTSLDRWVSYLAGQIDAQPSSS